MIEQNQLLEMGRNAFDREQAMWSQITSATDAEVRKLQAEQNQFVAEMFGGLDADERHPEDVRAEARRQQDTLDNQGREAFASEWAKTNRGNYS